MITNFNENTKKSICKCLNNANISTNIGLDGLCTKNAWSIFFWDNLNTEINSMFKEMKRLDSLDLYVLNRGPWDFLIMYKDGVIYSFMREQRLEQLRKDLEKTRASHHYAVNMAKVLNIDVHSKEPALFEVDSMISDADRESVDKLLDQVIEEHSVIKNYVVVLFDADKTTLYSARMALLNGRLEICEEENLSQYIQITESVVVESSNDELDEVVKAPSSRLKIRSKAQQIKANKTRKIRTLDNDISKDNNLTK